MTSPPSAPLRVVAIGPHPDDVEIFVGGIIAGAARRGHEVVLLDLSQGELASRGTVETRAREAAEAARILGVHRRENLGLPDGGIDARNDEQVRALVRALRRARPHVVLAPWREERHPDHVEAYGLATRAAFFCGLAKYDAGDELAPCPEPELLFYTQRVESRYDLLVDISADVSTKRAAIDAHASQTRPIAGAAGGVAPLVGSVGAIDALEARDRHLGALAGCAAAEGLIARSAVAVDDPFPFITRQGRRHLFPGSAR
jgi:bacillithiol biosynthesis deacetylase BshB1